jgi:hypothetical protein
VKLISVVSFRIHYVPFDVILFEKCRDKGKVRPVTGGEGPERD